MPAAPCQPAEGATEASAETPARRGRRAGGQRAIPCPDGHAPAGQRCAGRSRDCPARFRAAGMEPPASGTSLSGAAKRRRRKARAAQIPPAAGSDVPPTGI